MKTTSYAVEALRLLFVEQLGCSNISVEIGERGVRALVSNGDMEISIDIVCIPSGRVSVQIKDEEEQISFLDDFIEEDEDDYAGNPSMIFHLKGVIEDLLVNALWEVKR